VLRTPRGLPEARTDDRERGQHHSPNQPGTTTNRRGHAPCGDYALVILPALMQRVQTWMRRGAPSTIARTFWRFGLNRRLVAIMEWLREFPNEGPLPQL